MSALWVGSALAQPIGPEPARITPIGADADLPDADRPDADRADALLERLLAQLAVTPDDAITLHPLRGETPLGDCGPLAWDHHPLAPDRRGPWCVAWISLAGHPRLLAVGQPGARPAALLPLVIRAAGPSGAEATWWIASDAVQSAARAALDRWARAPQRARR